MEIKIPPDKSPENNDSFDLNKNLISFKTSLNNILLHNTNKNLIFDVVHRSSLIISHIYNFIKLFFIHLFDKKLSFPFINKICLTFDVAKKHFKNQKKN